MPAESYGISQPLGQIPGSTEQVGIEDIQHLPGTAQQLSGLGATLVLDIDTGKAPDEDKGAEEVASQYCAIRC